jgi:hypothetical protein
MAIPRNNAASNAVCHAGATGFPISDSNVGAAIVAIVSPFDRTHLSRGMAGGLIPLG